MTDDQLREKLTFARMFALVPGRAIEELADVIEELFARMANGEIAPKSKPKTTARETDLTLFLDGAGAGADADETTCQTALPPLPIDRPPT